ncbi:hypothetical protein RB598_005954 [Gaeumannomyces tritici]
MFATFSRQPARAHRLGHALSSMTGGEGYEVHHLVQGSAKVLGDVDLRGGTLVDVGGSHGFVSVDLARQHRRMRFIVQDLPRTIESAPNPVSEDGDATRRIEFTAHDFFTDQVVKGADVYLLRWILHNHSKPYAVSSRLYQPSSPARASSSMNTASAPSAKRTNGTSCRCVEWTP